MSYYFGRDKDDIAGDWTCVACGCENDEDAIFCWQCECDPPGHHPNE